MKITDIHRRTDHQPAPLTDCLRQLLVVDSDPSDSVYQQRYAAEMIEGFRVLSLLTFASMAVLFVVQLVQPHGPPAGTYEGPTSVACALLACAGGVGLLVSKSIRSPKTAFLTAAALLAAAVVVLSVDTLQRTSGDRRSTSSTVPVIFSSLLFSAALLPLRPRRVLGLGALLVAGSGLTAGLMGVPFRADVVDLAGAATAVAVSVVIAARSTSHRIRIHQAHVSAMEAEREAKAARRRALIAESAITMERLAASLSHEMNTPIATLRSATETLIRGVKREASFPPGSRMPRALAELSGAITASTSRLTETVVRIQRFANLDRSAVRLVDINQLVQDAVALMNPPSGNQSRVELNLQPLPQIWCRPHGLMAAITSILNNIPDSALPATIDTHPESADVVVKIARSISGVECQEDANLAFAVVGGRIRASGWDLFAARQLVRENGGDLRLNGLAGLEQVVTITLPTNAGQLGQNLRLGATVVT